METKLIKTKSIKIDDNLYPREKWNWITKARYYKAMKQGSQFPPICIAKKTLGKYVLIDGLHRLLATKDLKQTHIECEILIGLTDKQIFEEAVKRNSTHGKQFSTFEIVKIVAKLEDFKFTPAEISDLVMIPATELKEFVAKRTALITETNKDTTLKSPLKHLAEIGVDVEPEQSVFHSTSQVKILESVLTLLENDYINKDDEVVVRYLKKIYKLLIPIFTAKEIEVKNR